MKVRELELQVRTSNVLHKMGVDDLELAEFVERYGVADLREQPYCGVKSVTDLRETLELAGFRLSQVAPCRNISTHPAHLDADLMAQ